MIFHLGRNASSYFKIAPKYRTIRFTQPNSRIKGLVVFSAKWCGHCQRLKPILQRLDQANFGAVPIVVIDVDEDEMIQKIFPSMGLPIEGFPTIYLINLNGRILHEPYKGPRTLDDLQQAIQTLHPCQIKCQVYDQIILSNLFSQG